MSNQNILDLPELTSLDDDDLVFVQPIGRAAGTATLSSIKEAGAGIWTPPANWPVMQPLSASDQAMRCQIQITALGQNIFQLWAVGAYRVDWGDSSVTSHTSSSQAVHTYNYDLVTANEITENGYSYKIVEVNVTPTTATWTGVGVATRPTTLYPLSSSTSNPIVNLEIAGQSLTTIYIASQAGTQYWIPRYLKRVVIRSCSTATQVGNNALMFQNCYTLEQFECPTTFKPNSGYKLFSYCRNLKKTPTMDLTACTTLAYMHEQMRALKYPAAINAPIATDVSGLWYVCTSLEVLPVCYHPIATNYSYYISSCSALSRFTTGISFAGGTNFNNFASYSSLLRDTLATSGHTWPMSGVTTMDSAFLDSGVTVLPEIGTVGCTAFSSLLGYKGLTLTIPASYNFASATAGQLNFTNAYSLEWIYATPPTISHSLAHNSLSTNALNDYFSRLPIAVAQTIAVTGNPGSATCNTTIATLKGWVVII